MTLTTLILQLILTIPLTLILNNINRKNNNTINKIIFPTIYIILISAILPVVKENIFLIVIFEMFLRNFYVSNFTHKSKNITMFLIESLLSIALSLFAYNNFISQVNNVLPNAETIKPFLWFLIIIYIYNLCKPELNKVNKLANDPDAVLFTEGNELKQIYNKRFIPICLWHINNTTRTTNEPTKRIQRS